MLVCMCEREGRGGNGTAWDSCIDELAGVSLYNMNQEKSFINTIVAYYL